MSRCDSCDDGGALPPPLAGEGWGEGVSAMGQSPGGESPHPSPLPHAGEGADRLPSELRAL
ncbi:hypothetical protein E4K66_09785 [Bradyrhizobium frederickii]|uniref:Uncharacterized protein n=1 Tax=Bradyrhizobium frederickii TaxID=2560054 RepID=A0A4Y9L8I9_9BRAD|nr:hypothetical protein E4K66_09785 [Bradyrhizobium frederickii]